MLKFKEWLIINETKEEKALAAELAGDALTDLSTVIPKNNKNADKLLLLAAYYYSITKDKDQIKTDMTDYIGYLNRDKMKLITVDLVSKKPDASWDNYLRWTQAIHGQQGEDTFNQRSKFKPSQDDFQSEKPFMTSQDGQIKVYEANSPQQCIILGRGQTFCISQPGNVMWQSYRDNQTSTFYFVYDDTRDDRLSIVVVDVTEMGIVLTDRVNTTGTTLDPYTGKLTDTSRSYMKYLKEKGIDTSKLVNIPKSPEEKKEHEELGQTNDDLDWFIALSHDYKSKYIGRGHLLTNEQFDYLWKSKFTSLLTQYVKTGLKLNDHQLDKIAKDRDLRDNYIHNRIIADQQYGNLSDKEYSLMNFNQKKNYYEKMKNYNKVEKAIRLKDSDMVRYLVETGEKISAETVLTAIKTGNLNLVKYLVDDKKASLGYYSVVHAAATGNLDLVKYLVDEKGAEIGDHDVSNAAKSGNLDLVKYLVDDKNAKIGDDAVARAAESGNLALVKYLEDDKNAEIDWGYYWSRSDYIKNNDIIEYLSDIWRKEHYK